MKGSKETNRSLQVESGTQVVLSPESTRFTKSYRQIRPRTAEELRELVGLSVETATALRRAGKYCERSSKGITTVGVEDLDSMDRGVRARAHRITGNALEHYILGLDPEVPVKMKATFARYLEIWEVVLNAVALPELVEVNDGATLSIYDTHLVQGKRILIHGTGKVVCIGVMKVEVDTIIGN